RRFEVLGRGDEPLGERLRGGFDRHDQVMPGRAIADHGGRHVPGSLGVGAGPRQNRLLVLETREIHGIEGRVASAAENRLARLLLAEHDVSPPAPLASLGRLAEKPQDLVARLLPFLIAAIFAQSPMEIEIIDDALELSLEYFLDLNSRR